MKNSATHSRRGATSVRSSPNHVATFMRVDGKFVPIQHFRGPLLDDLYVEGALEWMIGDIMISCTRYWDLIDQLGGYIIQGLEKVRNGQPFETYWPDQPIRLAIVPLGDRKLRIERSGTSDPDVNIVTAADSVFDALIDGARSFSHFYAQIDSDW